MAKQKEVLLRIPEALHEKVQKLATRERRSVNKTYELLVAKRFGGNAKMEVRLKFDQHGIEAIKKLTMKLNALEKKLSTAA